MRSIAVGEDLLLVEERSGRPLPVAQHALDAAARAGRGGVTLSSGVHQASLSTMTRQHRSIVALAADVRAGRRAADAAAAKARARVVALATSPLPFAVQASPTRRAVALEGAYGAVARRSPTWGLHLAVSIDSADEGVAVLDRIRCWLPVLVALTANSPFSDGEDTGHVSWRAVLDGQWPGAGPVECLGNAAAYGALERALLATGVLLDAGMIGLPARLSSGRTTLEVQIADVCLDVAAAVVVAAVVRALVETAAREWRRGMQPDPAPAAVLRLAIRQAALTGVHGPLVDPVSARPASAAGVLGRLLVHILPALEDLGDDRLVVDGLARILEGGSGADRQRRALGRRGRLADVVADAVLATHSDPVSAPAGGRVAAAIRSC